MKINVNHTDKLDTAIEAVEGKATARTITAEELQDSAEKLQGKLDAIMLKKDQVGVSFWVDYNAQHFPNAYQYTPQSTQAKLTRTVSGWFVTDIRRDVTETPARRHVPDFTEIALEAIKKYMESGRYFA